MKNQEKSEVDTKAMNVEEQRSHFDRMWSQNWLAVQDVGPLTAARYRLMMRELRGRTPQHARILDVGCGNGTFMEMLGHSFPDAEILGVELSPQAVESASSSAKGKITVGDIVELAAEFQKNPFDVVVCSEVLEHVDDPHAVLSAIASVLKPKGVVVLTVPALMRHWCSQDVVAGHQRRFELDQMESLIGDSGLQKDHQFLWGGPLAQIYNNSVSRVGPERVMRSGSSPLVRLAARVVGYVLRLEDAKEAKSGFQLVARAHKP